MADWPPVIDADGHVLERQSDIRKYLKPPWDRRNTGLWPSDQPFDTDLFDTLGYPGYKRDLSPAQQVETPRARYWLCRLSFTDPRYAKYPRLPVLACDGYRPITEER